MGFGSCPLMILFSFSLIIFLVYRKNCSRFELSCSNNAYTVLCSRFNHKTGAEDVHFTASSSNSESEDDVDGSDESIVDEEALDKKSSIDKTKSNTASDVSDSECSLVTEDDTSMLEMIMIKDVNSGAEVSKFLSAMWFFLNFH